MKRMKILLINDYFELIGGTERYVMGLHKALSEEHDVYVFSFSNKKLSGKNIRILEIPKNKLSRCFRDYVFSPKVYCELKRYIERINPDIIHVNNNNLAPISILLAISESNARIVRTIHDYGFICPTSMRIKPNGNICNEGFGINCLTNRCVAFRWMIIHILEKKIRDVINRNIFDLYLSPTMKLKYFLEKNKIHPVVYLPIFTQIENNTYEEKTYFIKNEIIYVGALRKYKGLEYLLKAINLVRLKIPDVKLYIIGSGDDEFYFKNLCEKLQIEKNVFFTGKITDEDLISFYKKAEMLVMPSIWQEQFGLVGIEALSFGKPVIGTNVGGIPEWLEDGKSGFLIPPKDYIKLAEKIITLLNNEDLVRKMGGYGKNSVKQKYSKKTHVIKLQAIYKKMVADNDEK